LRRFAIGGVLPLESIWIPFIVPLRWYGAYGQPGLVAIGVPNLAWIP